MLLSDKPTADYLRDEVVCSWKQVRPVPQVTIDFGDGKVMRRTLAGNTILFLSLPDGTVVDAYPGVYRPEEFLQELKPGLAAAHQAMKLPPTERAGFLMDWHASNLRETVNRETQKLTMSKSGIESPILAALRRAVVEVAPAPVPTTPSKAMVEAPILRSVRLTAGEAIVGGDPLDRYAARLDDISKRPSSPKELRAPLGLGESAPGDAVVARLLQVDSQTNVRWVRPAIHMLLAQTDRPRAESLSPQIYKRILHLDVDDPYLGLRDLLVPGTP